MNTDLNKPDLSQGQVPREPLRQGKTCPATHFSFGNSKTPRKLRLSPSGEYDWLTGARKAPRVTTVSTTTK